MSSAIGLHRACQLLSCSSRCLRWLAKDFQIRSSWVDDREIVNRRDVDRVRKRDWPAWRAAVRAYEKRTRVPIPQDPEGAEP